MADNVMMNEDEVKLVDALSQWLAHGLTEVPRALLSRLATSQPQAAQALLKELSEHGTLLLQEVLRAPFAVHAWVHAICMPAD